MKEDLSFELHAKIENVDDVLVGKYKSSPAL
jgi:hypothetical protein